MKRTIPYPAVFHDWAHPDTHRVAASQDKSGVRVEMLVKDYTWIMVVLTEEDACLLAAKLLSLASEEKLCKKVLKR